MEGIIVEETVLETVENLNPGFKERYEAVNFFQTIMMESLLDT